MRDYRYFIEIAQRQSIRVAAESLYVTPSALNKYVQRLENELGVRLFERADKKYVLTDAGMRYLDWCVRMDALERDCQEEMKRIAYSSKKCIRVGFPFMRVKLFIDSVIPEFRRRYPQVDLSFYERNTAQIWPMFFANSLDVVFMYRDPATLTGNIGNTLISTENMVICAPKGHPLKGRARPGFPYPWVDLRELGQEALIVVTDSVQETISTIEEIFLQYLVQPHIVMRTMTFESIAIAVSQGIGISILSDLLLRHLGYLDKVELYSFGEKPLTAQYRAFFHDSAYIGQEVQALIGIAKDSSGRYAPRQP